MIRIEEPEGWILVEHRDHARLAGAFAERWNNADFAAPEPRDEVLEAVRRHDDAWAERDAAPCLTREGRPSAFSRELVGTYSAFEEMDLEEYLAVRGRAAELVAGDHPYAAILISLHTVDLLTKRADLSRLTADQRGLHGRFIAAQRARQTSWCDALGVALAGLQRAFEFLQACDSLSLAVCVRYQRSQRLRHRHPRRDGTWLPLECTPLGGDTYRVDPYPFECDEFACAVPARRVPGRRFGDLAAFRAAVAAAPPEPLTVRIVR